MGALKFKTFEIGENGIIYFSYYRPHPQNISAMQYLLEDASEYVGYTPKLVDVNKTIWEITKGVNPPGLNTEQTKTLLEIRSNVTMTNFPKRFVCKPDPGSTSTNKMPDIEGQKKTEGFKCFRPTNNTAPSPVQPEQPPRSATLVPPKVVKIQPETLQIAPTPRPEPQPSSSTH